MEWIKSHAGLVTVAALGAVAIFMYGGTVAQGINNYLQTNAQTNQENQEANEAQEYSQTLALQNALSSGLANSTTPAGTSTIPQSTVGGSPSPLTANQQVSALSGAGISTSSPGASPDPALVPSF